MKFVGRLTLSLACLLLFLASGTAIAHQHTASDELKIQTDHYLDDFYFPYHPVDATEAGVHLYDGQLQDYSKKGIERTLLALKKFEKIIKNISTETSNETEKADRDLLLNHIRSQILTLTRIRPWEKNPDYYASSLTESAFALMERNFAPADIRLQALINREKQMPAALENAHVLLKNPPHIYTEIALEQLPGLIAFFQKDVPLAFANVKDEKLQNEFKKSNHTVIKALEAYQHWLKESILPVSHGDFRIGEKTLREKLAYDEMVDLPLSRLLTVNTKNMRENQRLFKQVQKEIRDQKDQRQTQPNYPSPDKLLVSFEANFDKLIVFIKDKKIITIPSDKQPILQETPPFLRATTFASMDTPGPYEKVATDAFMNVTFPHADWNKEKTADFMKNFFNFPEITSVAIHEAYPGHYVQFLWSHDITDRVRTLPAARTNFEGWAHYCEQMMLDEGLGQTEDSLIAKELRLAELKMALLRNARFTVAIKMHAGKMTFNEAVNFFVKEGYQPLAAGIVEAKRGTADPTYLAYTLGKLQILKLQHDMKAKLGTAFNLQTFHDDFMRQGFVPIKIIRKSMLNNDSPTL
ncbi:MAG TPA: DUF885 domain-containing protein [Gammaproteobacteria bacterium]|jgi:uncharacterized protein (DUF885 family)|nr:DUF885 domain-containing protein [Gammaproteobacteria bacterium]